MNASPRTEILLTTHKPVHLERTDVPLFISHRRLREYKKLPRARGRWALDSGGFTAISKDGGWDMTAREYVDHVRRYRDEIGGLMWAAPMDWMCEGWVTESMKARGNSGLVREHQLRTVMNFVELMSIDDTLPIIPVIQGWWDDGWRVNYDRPGWQKRMEEPYTAKFSEGLYSDCIEMYEKAGVDLKRFPLIGIGSVCRKQSTGMPFMLNLWNQVRPLLEAGCRFHGFGFKTEGLELLQDAVIQENHVRAPGWETWMSANIFASVDSLAWSYDARHPKGMTRGQKLPEHAHAGHARCNNCIEYGLHWRSHLINKLPDLMSA